MEDNVRKKLLLLLLFLWYCLSVSILAPLLIGYFFEEHSLLTELFAELLSVVIPVLILKMIKNKNNDQLLFRISNAPLKEIGIRKILASVLMISAFYFCIQYLQNGFHILNYIRTGDFGNVYTPSYPNCLTFLLSVLVYALLPAVFEEMHFRTFYCDSYRNYKPLILMLCSSLAFASAHINSFAILNAFLIGVLLMLIYRKHCSFIMIVLLHFIHNLLDIVFSAYWSIPYSILDILEDYANDAQKKAAVLISFSLALFSLSVLLLTFRYVTANEKNDTDKAKDPEISAEKPKIAEHLITAAIMVMACALIFMKAKGIIIH